MFAPVVVSPLISNSIFLHRFPFLVAQIWFLLQLPKRSQHTMILRFRSKDGMIRVTADNTGLFLSALEEAVNKFKIENPQQLYVSNKQGEKGTLAAEFGGKTNQELQLKNGDMLYLTYELSSHELAPQSQPTVAQTVSGNVTVSIDTDALFKLPEAIKTPQLAVDDLLDLQKGLIPRPRLHFCRHGDKGMCEYCSPLPPWDKEYLKEQGIKHKSFHAHLKELNEQHNNRNKALSYIAPLEEPIYAINLNCGGGHAPYPKGICSKCQPAPITLSQQDFRMVDHVEFADHSLLNSFIDTWRQAGTQRFGVLYGRYEPFDKVPLGIKAVVEAIYEPPQAGELDGITLLKWENEKDVNEVAEAVGLYPVGVVFTDLTDAGARDGSVLCKRHKDLYFMSCLEVLMAARNQSRHPNFTKHSQSGVYLSKFVTCVVTGNLKGQIEPRAYQVLASAEALVKADDICGSTQPNMLYINSTTGTRYVPDMFYSKINEYGLEVKTNAKPAFPVDYLLVTLLDSFPLEPTPAFSSSFPIANRDFLGDLQDLRAVSRQLQLGAGDGSQLFDFHFLVYLHRMQVLSKEEFALVARYVKDRNYEDYMQLVETGGWMTLLTILEQSL